MKEIDVFCGGATAQDNPERETLILDVQGDSKNVELKVEAISKTVMGNIPDIIMDLLEVGSYVYCADQHIGRGSETLADYGEKWRRAFHFIIAVRNPDFWNKADVLETLQDTLGFLSGETYNFTFVQAADPVQLREQYFDFIDGQLAPDEIALFSGGVDSFAGAVESIVGQQKTVALVGHHSANKVQSVQKQLIDGLQTKGYGKQAQFISIKVRNSQSEAKEYTQRTRSFLFACLGMCIAQMYGKDRFTFYENGVVSLNLPLTKDVLESRATRTTHPRALNGFKSLFDMVVGKNIVIDHPFQWLTKKEVTEKIKKHGCESLLVDTNSCTRPRTWTRKHSHCGVCSQCIDRRFSILAAGMGEYEPADKYKVDLLKGARVIDRDINMAASYVRFAQDFKNLTKSSFVNAHPQITSALSEFDDLTTDEAETKIFELYKQHTDDVMCVMQNALDEYSEQIVANELPSTSLLSIFFNRSKLDAPTALNYDEQLKSTLDHLGEQRCDFYFDDANERVVFKGGFEIKGDGYKLMTQLIGNFRKGKNENDEIAFINAGKLASDMGKEEASLRRSIMRLRDNVAKQLGEDIGVVFDTDGFIENSQTKGYRLNRNLREVSSLSDL